MLSCQIEYSKCEVLIVLIGHLRQSLIDIPATLHPSTGACVTCCLHTSFFSLAVMCLIISNVVS